MRFQVPMTPALQRYVEDVSVREPDLLRQLRKTTSEALRGSKLSFADRLMATSPDQGQLLSTLVRATGARRAVEVGVFTGYSLLCTALALPPDGRVIGCEINEEWAAIAADHVERAGVADRVEIRIGDARQTLADLLANGAAGTIDFVFVDADKFNYLSYYESGLELLRPGGLMVVDNVLWHGRVAVEDADEPETLALREFNLRLHRDERIDLTVLPVNDGMTLAVKR
jgi:predicted O-methyltransferase YrrM